MSDEINGIYIDIYIQYERERERERERGGEGGREGGREGGHCKCLWQCPPVQFSIMPASAVVVFWFFWSRLDWSVAD